MASLEVVKTNQRMPMSVPVLKPVTVIGRQGTCDLELKWDGISRVHTSILGSEPDGSGIMSKWRIVDQGGGNNNGTFVNGERVQERDLRDGDIIGFGKGRSVPIGGHIAPKNIEYAFLWRVVKTTPAMPRGKLQHGMAESGAHRHLRGPSRHPLGGHAVAGEQKERKQAQSEFPAGEMVHPCKSVLFPPSSYTPSKADHRGPPSELWLEYCYGYRGHDLRSSVHYINANTIVYPAGSMVVKLDMSTNTQSFFTDHDDDVVCLAVSANKKFVASGQIASRLRRDEESNRPSATVLVWEAFNMRRAVGPTPPAGTGWSSRGVLSRTHLHRIQALDFDPSGQYLVTFGGDQNNASAICVYDWRKGSIFFKLPAGCTTVHVVKHNPFARGPYSFVQCGNRNVRAWDYEKAKTSPEQSFTMGAMLKHTGGMPCGVNDVAFIDASTFAAAMSTGAIFLFGPVGPVTSVMDKIPNGRGGGLAHDGEVMSVLWDKRGGLVSSGQDGFVRVWSFEWEGGKFREQPRLVKQVSVRQFAPSGFQGLCVVASMDMLDGKLLCGTRTNSILEIEISAMEQTGHEVKHASVRMVHVGHCGESRMDKRSGVLLPSVGTNAVSCFPAPLEQLVATVAGDMTLRVWDTKLRRTHRMSGGKEAIVSMGMVGTCVDISDDASMIAVGHDTGDFTVWDVATFKCLLQNNFRRQGILCIRFSPGGRYLAVGSQEQSIDVYDMQSGFRRIGQDNSRHSTSVCKLDWSSDGQYIRSNDKDAFILYWHAPVLKPFTGHTGFFRDTKWATESSLFGWDRKHIFEQGRSISDVNAVAVSPSKASLVTSDDFGMVTLFRYPAISDQLPCKSLAGHSSHVLDLGFTHDDRFLMSVGSFDLCVFQWRHVTGQNHAMKEAHKLGGMAMRAND